MRLGQAILFASNVEKMQTFYAEAFDLEVKDGAAADGFVRLVDPEGGAVLALHTMRGKSGDGRPRTTVPTKLCFEAANAAAIAEAIVRAKAAGARMEAPQSFEGITICDGVDPEGNVFQLTTRS